VGLFLMTKCCHDQSMLEAAQRADQLVDDGEMAGADTWHRILNATERLRAAKPPRAQRQVDTTKIWP
jgi:hypothetical protein